jgi:endonuclease/exonuclease/phosphatase family metal-dependent hydrolase
VAGSASLALTSANREPRNAIDARIACDFGELHILATHLGLRPAERRMQVQRLLAALPIDHAGACVVMGDLNEWYLWGRPLRWLQAKFGAPASPATFPALRPFLKLDRIWAHPPGALHGLHAHVSALSRVASDHLPLVATYVLPATYRAGAKAAAPSTARSMP